MDYKEIRRRNSIKKRGGTTEGRSIEAPKRVDYGLRRKVIILCILMAVSAVLGAALVVRNADVIFPEKAAQYELN